VIRRLNGEDVSLHRSAAIAKAVGSGVGSWHTDYSFRRGRPRNTNDVLNNTEFSSVWFYLNGTHPSRAGLAIIPDSHTMDWAPPAGFALTEDRGSFYREGGPPGAYDAMDIPGVLPLFTDPGDLIIFAGRTYHGVYPHGGDETRLSCAFAFRSGRRPHPTAWPLPESARRFIAAAPPSIRPLVEHYPGIVPGWKGGAE
jgi:ectoine hydroxylase-related dioxygenase (phytanoyl-CoA dioxygenase family)